MNAQRMHRAVTATNFRAAHARELFGMVQELKREYMHAAPCERERINAQLAVFTREFACVSRRQRTTA